MKLRLTFALLAAMMLAPIASAAELNLFAWSEYVPQEVIDGFKKETGITVNYETYASNEEMLSKLLAGASNYDLLQPSEYTVEALIKMHKLAPIDWAKVPNIKNIGPAYLHLGFDPKQQYSIPWMTGTVGICVNTAVVHDPIHGYHDVFQDKYKNRIVVVNDNREMASWVMDTLGIPVNDMNAANLKRVRPVLGQWLKLIKVFDSDSPKTALINGDCDLGVVWSGEAALCYQQSPKFQYVLPSEGAHLFVDNLVIPSSAEHKEEATQFLNYVLQPDVSKLISDKFPYTNPNLEARKLLTPAQLANPASYPKPTKLEIFHDIGKEAGAIDRMVTDLKSAQ